MRRRVPTEFCSARAFVAPGGFEMVWHRLVISAAASGSPAGSVCGRGLGLQPPPGPPL